MREDEDEIEEGNGKYLEKRRPGNNSFSRLAFCILQRLYFIFFYLLKLKVNEKQHSH